MASPTSNASTATFKSPRRGANTVNTLKDTSSTPVKRSVSFMAPESSKDDFPTRQLPKAPAPARRFAIEAPPSSKSSPSLASRGGPGGDRHRSSTGLHELQQSSRPILKPKEPWQTWHELTIRIANLPPPITTWDLWERFQREGTIVFIELFDDRQGRRDGNAKIRFAPPPHRDFWTLGNVTLSTPDAQGAFQVKIFLEAKKRRFEVQSPIRNHIWYPEVMVLHPRSLAFGFMHGPNTIMEMYNATSLSRNGTVFKVDLLRSRIVVTFEVALTEDPESRLHSVSSPHRPGELDRINRYMFTIPFGQLEKLDRIQLSGNQWALVVSLESPPQFFRKRLDPMASHTKEALTWSEFDTWYRQTDIIYDPRRLVNAVVSLKKELPVIDIGRWTTYYILFDKIQDDHGTFDLMKSSLQDHNIDTSDIQQPKIISGVPPTIWPVLDPPISIQAKNESKVHRLPFEVRYQLEVCISQGIMNVHNLTPEFVSRLTDMAEKDQTSARNVLEYAAEQEKRIYDPMTIFDDREALAYSPRSKIPYYCAYSRKAIVTPTTLYFSSPTVETTNRVIRKYAEKYGDRFLRVQFTDEIFEGRINSCADKARNDEIFTRVYRTLLNGIRMGDRHYQFLAFGNSQFRENGAYFFCPTEDLNCADIRHWMGDFTSIKIVAKYAARLGLCFSTTRAIRSNKTTINRIEDVERNGYCFTDGVGKISDSLAVMIAKQLSLPLSNLVPSAFQFRLGGGKGMLVNWPGMSGDEVSLRKSQWKFEARYDGLEIIRCSRFSTATLNRQTITILSSLGVKDEIFNKMLSAQLQNYQAAMSDTHLALDLLSRYIDDNHMTMTIASMVLDGFMEAKEPFLFSLLHLWRAWSIKLLKEKAKIIVEKGAFLFGVTDETGTLRGHKNSKRQPGSPVDINELPQVFIQVPDRTKKGSYVVIDGLCLVGRNPSLFPGDIRMVQAVNVPALHHLRDVIVFSQLGDRDVPSMCSGGDLDGDDFFCIWDKALTPTEWNVEPMNYTAAKPKELNRPVEIQDIMRFFVRFMKNDALPTIAHAHMALSDYLDRGVKDPKCIELAELHSKAVDYVKTGEPAEMPKRLRPRKWPHFMEKKYKPKDQIYTSTKILGQLYDKVESVNFVPQYELPFDERIIRAYNLDDAILKTARQLKCKYDTAIRRIMAQHDIKTEFEVWSTFVLSKPRVGSDYKMQEEMAIVSDALKDRFRKVCIEAAGGKDSEKLRPFVAAMYRVTREEMRIALLECREIKIKGGKEEPKRKMEPKFMPLISFPWLFHDILGRIATGIEQREDLENLGFSFVSTTKEKSNKFNSVRDESDLDDVVETAEGITHRGELLDLFRPDDVDSDGDAVEQPYQGHYRPTPNYTSYESDDESGARRVEASNSRQLPRNVDTPGLISDENFPSTTSPLQGMVNSDRISAAFSSIVNSRSFSPSMAELASLELSGDLAPPKPQLKNIAMERKGRAPSNSEVLSVSDGSFFADLDDVFVSRRQQVEEEVENEEHESKAKQVEELEVFFDCDDESPLERLARLTGG